MGLSVWVGAMSKHCVTKPSGIMNITHLWWGVIHELEDKWLFSLASYEEVKPPVGDRVPSWLINYWLSHQSLHYNHRHKISELPLADYSFVKIKGWRRSLFDLCVNVRGCVIKSCISASHTSCASVACTYFIVTHSVQMLIIKNCWCHKNDLWVNENWKLCPIT